MGFITSKKNKIPSLMSNASTFVDYVKNKFEHDPLKYLLLVLLIFFFSLTIHFIPTGDEYTWRDADDVEHTELSGGSTANRIKNQDSYYASIALFIIIACLCILKIVPSENKRAAFFMGGGLSALIILYYILINAGIYEYILINTGIYEHTKNVGYIFFTVIACLLFYRSLKGFIKNLDGWEGFVLNFILYIPCLIDDFMEYLKGNFARTSNITYILLGIEALLITAYIALPSLISSPLKGDAFPIMNEANFFDKRNGNGKTQIDFRIIKDVYGYNDDDSIISDKDNEYEIGKHKFTLSMWIYLNQQDSSISSSCGLDLFSYSAANGSYSHPSIKYSGVENGKNKLNIKLSGNDDDDFELNVESQKWNNIVFNYNGNFVDIFINGDLVKSHNIVVGGLKIDNYDIFSYGGSEEDIDGAICNIKYYKKPLSKFQIVNIYNLLKGQNPPINNIM